MQPCPNALESDFGDESFQVIDWIGTDKEQGKIFQDG